MRHDLTHPHRKLPISLEHLASCPQTFACFSRCIDRTLCFGANQGQLHEDGMQDQVLGKTKQAQSDFYCLETTLLRGSTMSASK